MSYYEKMSICCMVAIFCLFLSLLFMVAAITFRQRADDQIEKATQSQRQEVLGLKP